MAAKMTFIGLPMRHGQFDPLWRNHSPGPLFDNLPEDVYLRHPKDVLDDQISEIHRFIDGRTPAGIDSLVETRDLSSRHQVFLQERPILDRLFKDKGLTPLDRSLLKKRTIEEGFAYVDYLWKFIKRTQCLNDLPEARRVAAEGVTDLLLEACRAHNRLQGTINLCIGMFYDDIWDSYFDHVLNCVKPYVDSLKGRKGGHQIVIGLILKAADLGRYGPEYDPDSYYIYEDGLSQARCFCTLDYANWEDATLFEAIQADYSEQGLDFGKGNIWNKSYNEIMTRVQTIRNCNDYVELILWNSSKLLKSLHRLNYAAMVVPKALGSSSLPVELQLLVQNAIWSLRDHTWVIDRRKPLICDFDDRSCKCLDCRRAACDCAECGCSSCNRDLDMCVYTANTLEDVEAYEKVYTFRERSCTCVRRRACPHSRIRRHVSVSIDEYVHRDCDCVNCKTRRKEWPAFAASLEAAKAACIAADEQKMNRKRRI